MSLNHCAHAWGKSGPGRFRSSAPGGLGGHCRAGQWDEFRLPSAQPLLEGRLHARRYQELLLQQAIYCGVACRHHAVKEASVVPSGIGAAER